MHDYDLREMGKEFKPKTKERGGIFVLCILRSEVNVYEDS
jgi:hypothetical protein